MARIIYHEVYPGEPCTDGLASAWVTYKANPNALIQGSSYGQHIDFNRPDKLFVVDYSLPISQYESLISKGYDITIIDHHASAFEMLLASPVSCKLKLYFDLIECGSTAAWQYFFKDEPMPIFLKYIRDVDMHYNRYKHSTTLYEALEVTGKSFAEFDKLANMNEDQLIKYAIKHSETRKAIADALTELAIKSAKHDIMMGSPIISVRLDKQQNPYKETIAKELANLNPDATFIAMYSHIGSVSLRSYNGFDVSTIAKAKGGGGHKFSSAYRL